MGLVTREARGVDFLEALSDDGTVVVWRHRRHFGLHCRQLDGGVALTARTAAGELVCIGGIYATPAGDGEAWLAVGPGFAAHPTPAVRALRRLFEQLGQASAPLAVVALVAPKGVAGARLARWLGFEDEGLRETGLGLMHRWVRRFE